MYRKIGSKFTYKGNTYEVKELPENEIFCCQHCCFIGLLDCSSIQKAVCGECEADSRGDGKNAYYVKVK